jgi:hypothetical protein
MHVKRLRDEGTVFTLFWKVGILPWAVVGVTLDLAFNVVAGTLMYMELPQELTFTSRCKRHIHSPGWRSHIARWWQRQLNQISPGHVK